MATSPSKPTGVRVAQSQGLVDDEMMFTDLALMPWSLRISEVMSWSWDEVCEELSHVSAWYERMVSILSWKPSMKFHNRLGK
ncbi:hypothetical protein BCON_0160g00120 [Botryotinia convoluta]|uniref:GST C-terminal domain-containing protein n=1 Tax=Botryotinia convoluta TaxID=54673 RepID=A0A4Z1I463_9HELO|nr:hypothetical protein BCON_0160g00120 [Botryotinia convoluta]